MKNKNVSTGVIWGAILGVIYCLVSFLRWSMAAQPIVFGVVTFIGYLLILGLLFAEASYIKKKQGTYVELKEIFQALFISVLIFELFYALFNMFYLRANPGVIDIMSKARTEMLDKGGFKLTDEQRKIDQKSLDDLKLTAQWGPAIQNYFTSVAVSGVLAFFIALIMRKRKPAGGQ